jgi:hypothetical protein
LHQLPGGAEGYMAGRVHSVARHLGISGEQAQEAIHACGHRLKRAGNAPHSVSLIYGWAEE